MIMIEKCNFTHITLLHRVPALPTEEQRHVTRMREQFSLSWRETRGTIKLSALTFFVTARV